MTPLELRASISLAAVFGLRLLGMFIILPVFALYAAGLPGWDKTWIGIALGIYGLTQAVMQVPFGWASDRIGRKPVLYVGLGIFAIGSFICALSTSVPGVVAGRMLQGAGAISAVAIAMAADLTRESQRTKAMAMIGITIGMAFALSFVVSPYLAATIGVPGIFALTGGLALLAVLVVNFIVPDADTITERQPVRWKVILLHTALMRLNAGIFILHAILMAMFVVVPFQLIEAGLAGADHWMLYLGVFALSVALMMPVIRSELAQARGTFIGAVALLALAMLSLAVFHNTLAGIGLGLVVFFTSFNVLEARLPALVSIEAPAGAKGSATGVYASLQFLGVFVGGAMGGVVAQYLSGVAVLWACFFLALAWLILAIGMRPTHS